MGQTPKVPKRKRLMAAQIKIKNLKKIKELLEKLIESKQITFYNEYFEEILYAKGVSITEQEEVNVLQVILDKEGATINLDH